MMNVLKISALVVTAGLTVGCASTSDIENLQSQIDSLNATISASSSKLAAAQSSADAAASKAVAAASKAAAAEVAATRAAQYAEDTNSKLDRVFKKSMMK